MDGAFEVRVAGAHPAEVYASPFRHEPDETDRIVTSAPTIADPVARIRAPRAPAGVVYLQARAQRADGTWITGPAYSVAR